MQCVRATNCVIKDYLGSYLAHAPSNDDDAQNIDNCQAKTDGTSTKKARSIQISICEGNSKDSVCPTLTDKDTQIREVGMKQQNNKTKQSSVYYQNMPQLTAGGSKEAEMATPTKELVLLPITDNATPIPEGTAIVIPTINPDGTPRLC